MDESLIDQGFLWFFGAVFAGPFIGWLVGLKGGFERGLAVGCLIIGLTGSYFAVSVGIDRAEQLRGTVAVEGRLLEFVEQKSKETDGSVSVTYAPRVGFVAADGEEHSVLGLGGSQQSKEIGAPVMVRYRAEQPDRVIVADFQNTWGPVVAFALFGGLPLLFGLFFLAQACFPDVRVAEQRILTQGDKVRLLWARYVTIGGNVLLLLSFIFMGVAPFSVLPVIGTGFCGIAFACLVYLLAELIRPARVWQRIFILFIVAAGFSIFGVLGLLLGFEI